MNTATLYDELFNAGILPWKNQDILAAYQKLTKYKCNMWLFAKWVRGHCQRQSIPPSNFPLEAWVNMYLEWQRLE